MTILTLEILKFIFIFSLIILFIVGILSIRSLFTYIKNSYRELWDALGRPSLILNNSIGNNIRFFSFLKKNEFIRFDDKTMTKKCMFIKRFFIVYILCFVLLFAVSIALSHLE